MARRAPEWIGSAAKRLSAVRRAGRKSLRPGGTEA